MKRSEVLLLRLNDGQRTCILLELARMNLKKLPLTN